jgi:hypothetical protein
MKHLPLFVLLTVCAIGFGLQSAPNENYRIRANSIFESEDEQVWHFMIETDEPTPYRIVATGRGGGGEISGDTSARADARHKSQEQLWLVFSQITPSSGSSAYTKTILKGRGGMITHSRELPKGTKVNRIVMESLSAAAQTNPMNTPVTLAEVDGQAIRLIVGKKAAEWRAEPPAAGNSR